MFFLGGLIFHSAALISFKHKSLKPYIYFITIFCWSCVLINYYTFDLRNIIHETGMLGRIFLLGFPLYILFPFTVLSLVLTEVDKGPRLKSLAWIGDITYSSYLLHFPLQLLFGFAVSFGIVSHSFYLNPLYLFLFFIILIPISYLTYIKFEKPMQRAIRERLLTQKRVSACG